LALTGFAALAVVATELAIMFFGATLPTPLYPLYRLAFGFGGISAALGYRGSLEVVNRIAPSDKHSEVVSSYLIAVYLGNSLPIIGIGLLSDLMSSIAAHLAFAVVIGLLAAVALVTGMKYAPQQ
jgi:hypothetical protein